MGPCKKKRKKEGKEKKKASIDFRFHFAALSKFIYFCIVPQSVGTVWVYLWVSIFLKKKRSSEQSGLRNDPRYISMRSTWMSPVNWQEHGRLQLSVTHAAVSTNTQVPYSVQLHIVCFCVSPYPWQPHYFHGSHIYIWQSHHYAVVNPVAIAIVGVALGGGKGGGWGNTEITRGHTSEEHVVCVCASVCVCG